MLHTSLNNAIRSRRLTTTFQPSSSHLRDYILEIGDLLQEDALSAIGHLHGPLLRLHRGAWREDRNCGFAMSIEEVVERRQIWARPTTTTSFYQPHCTPFHLPSKGLIVVDHISTITLKNDAVFHPECSVKADGTNNDTVLSSAIIDLRDPFYASTSPQLYAIATATVISYMLLIILFITPRTFFLGGSGGGGGFLGPRGLIGGHAPIIGIGGRPWLQKVATLSISISLTIASISTFKVAEDQYYQGYQDAIALTEEVAGSLELRIIRVVSTTFLWLAQAQTLIRLFPRYREKIAIKWTGFALIILDTIFSILNSFVDNGTRTRPRTFTDAIPALSYLFELALSLLYAAAVIYYAFRHRLFAFYHRKMRNVSLVALLSSIAILIPVVFFVLDIANSSLAGWGHYFRWVGSAAASVIVWEWVERIEALEREHKKDSILGDRIYDTDEMTTTTPYTEASWPGTYPHSSKSGRRRYANVTGSSTGKFPMILHGRSRLPPPYVQHNHQIEEGESRRQSHDAVMTGAILPVGAATEPLPSPPPSVVSPVDRTNTTSAASTVYAIRYHPLVESISPSPQISLDTAIPEEQEVNDRVTQSVQNTGSPQTTAIFAAAAAEHTSSIGSTNQRPAALLSNIRNVRNTMHAFKRRQMSPVHKPSEVAVIPSAKEDQQQTVTAAWLPTKFPRFRNLGIPKHLKSAEAPLPQFYFDVRPQALIDALAYRESLQTGVETVEPVTLIAGSSNAHTLTGPDGPHPRVCSPTAPQFSGSSRPDFARAGSPDPNNALYQRGSLMISDPRLSRFRHEMSSISYATLNNHPSPAPSSSRMPTLPDDVDGYMNIQDNGRQEPFVEEPSHAVGHNTQGNAAP